MKTLFEKRDYAGVFISHICLEDVMDMMTCTKESLQTITKTSFTWHTHTQGEVVTCLVL